MARRAGVAKGTIYLHFKDKEALFQELIRFQLNPVVGTFETALASELPLRAIVDQAIEIFVREIYGTHRKQVMRLIITEGPRFPALAEFYYREVLVAPAQGDAREIDPLARTRRDCRRYADPLSAIAGRGRPSLPSSGSGLFDRFEPLDVRAMMRAYFDRLFLQTGRPA